MILVMDGLTDPLRGWNKTFNPPTLQEAIKKARDMEASTSRSKFQYKGFPHKKDKGKKQFQRESHQPMNDSNRLDSEQLNDLKRRKLCFHCENLGTPHISAV